MTITISDGATSLELPSDLQWVDEFGWSSVEQETTYSITGALLVDQGEKKKGRPITLQSNGASWVPRSTVEALQAFYNAPDTTLSLTINGKTFAFQFARPGGFSVDELFRLASDLQGADHEYTIEIKGFEVAA